jgi:phenylpropionate dioxygenase-like ring-hydroxylating dioxygenase large terminal subunit
MAEGASEPLGDACECRAYLDVPLSRSEFNVVDIEVLQDAIAHAGATSLKESSVGIPMAAYSSPELFKLEVERVFRPAWLVLAHVDKVPTNGSFYTADLVGEPLLLTRDHEGEIHVFSRLCPHRGMSVVDGCGEAKRLSCPYHRWTFDLSGKLLAAPFMRDSEGFDEAQFSLHPVRFEIWSGFVFVNLDGQAAPLAPRLATLDEKMADRGMRDMALVDTIEFGELELDWKILLENSIECYHHLGTHSQSLQKLFPAEMSWADTAHSDFAITYSVAKAEGKAADSESTGDAPRLDSSQIFNENTGRLIHVFPFTRFALRKDNMTHFQIYPLAAGRIGLSVHFFLPRAVVGTLQAEEMKQHHAARLRVILSEDIEMCNRLQKMSSSRVTKVGRLSQLEEPIWNFYRYLATQLAHAPRKAIRVHQHA